MAEKKLVRDQTTPVRDENPDAPWVSSDVALAQAGQRVEMGQTIKDETKAKSE